MRTSRKTDFRKLKITLVTMTYHSQRPRCPSLSPHVLLVIETKVIFNFWEPVLRDVRIDYNLDLRFLVKLKKQISKKISG